jgi:endonuclease/exonuclease/phosphatase family metal-dependent hydrolase
MANVVCSSTRTTRFIHQLAVALIAICSIASVASAQTTVTLSAPGSHINADLTIQGGASGMTDFSGSDTLASKVSAESYTRRILLKFDTQNHIPANAVIQSAQLHLVLKDAESSENRPLTAYYVAKSFVTREANWYYFRSGQAWSTAGGDLGPSFGTTYVSNAVGSTYRFDLTRLVQQTVNGQFGSRYTRLALVDTGAASGGNYRAFHSTRAANAAYRPRLVITYGPSAAIVPPPTVQPPPPPAGTTLRVMQWNIHNSQGRDGVCSPDRIANTIVAQKAHVVGLNEVKTFAGACAYTFDMGQKLQSLLQQKTGLTWYRQYINVKGGTSGAGKLLLSQYRPVSSSSTLLSYTRGVVQMGIDVNGRTVNVFSTHVEYFTSSWRPVQITEAVRWMSTFAEPRIMMGDFNTTPGTSDYSIIAKPYQDAWAAAKSAGTATAYNGTGATKDSVRFDYVFHSRVAAVSLKSVKVPDTRINGVFPADHDPVVAEFDVN